jgi:hypothetical protein
MSELTNDAVNTLHIVEEGIGPDGIQYSGDYWTAFFDLYQKLKDLSEKNTPAADAEAGKILMDQLRAYVGDKDDE